MLAVFAFWYLGVELLLRIFARYDATPVTELLRMRDITLWIVAVYHGAFRVGAFHPLYRPGYLQWLQTTAWDGRKPLPLGPVQLVAQDLVLLAVLVLLSMRSANFHWEPLLLVFVFAYLTALSLTFPFRNGKLKAFAYAMGFGLGLIVLWWDRPTFALGACGALYGLGLFGLSRTLALLPMKKIEPRTPPPQESVFSRDLTPQSPQNPSALGWPFDRVRPFQPRGARVRALDGVLVGLLIGWWVYVPASRLASLTNVGDLLVLAFLSNLAILSFGRLLVYRAHCFPPISLLGRICTGKLIIPKHDQIYVAPIAIVLVGLASVKALLWIGWPLLIASPVSISLMWTAALNLGPTLEKWHLTGVHRVPTPRFARTAFVEV